MSVSDRGKTRILILRQQVNGREKMASSNQDKSKRLAKTFFPGKPTDAGNTYEHREYPAPVMNDLLLLVASHRGSQGEFLKTTDHNEEGKNTEGQDDDQDL